VVCSSLTNGSTNGGQVLSWHQWRHMWIWRQECVQVNCLQQQVCHSLLLGRNVCRQHCMLPPVESQWVCRRDRRTDRQTPDCYIKLSTRCSQHNESHMLLNHQLTLNLDDNDSSKRQFGHVEVNTMLTGLNITQNIWWRCGRAQRFLYAPPPGGSCFPIICFVYSHPENWIVQINYWQ